MQDLIMVKFWILLLRQSDGTKRRLPWKKSFADNKIFKTTVIRAIMLQQVLGLLGLFYSITDYCDVNTTACSKPTLEVELATLFAFAKAHDFASRGCRVRRLLTVEKIIEQTILW
jgi:hypothetical protein